MPQRKKLSRAEVESRLSPDQRVKLGELYRLSRVLEGSIIDADYKPSDDLRAAIALSPYGNWLLQQSKRFGFEVREGRLACLLELWHLEVLIDIDAIDLDALGSALSKEISDSRLRFPMIFGPQLYLQAADLFADERPFLNSVDTARLLEGQPTGVFQSGRWLGGPWGIHRHEDSRSIAPSHDVPLQHCHDVSCWRVHRVRLNSDSSAEIIKARSQIRKALESEGEESSEFASVLSDAMRDKPAQFDAESLGAIAFLIGDALSDSELRTLCQHLLDGPTAAQFRSQVRDLTKLSGASADIVAERTRAELLQIALLASDAVIATALDDLVLGNAGELGISVPVHEVRRSMLTRASASDFGSRPELSRLGIRTTSTVATGPMKLRTIIDLIYFSEKASPTRLSEIEWQLRVVPGVSIEARLTEFLRKTSPDEAIRRLILNSAENVRISCDALRLRVPNDISDEDLLARMMWKLGFDVPDPDSFHDDFWRHSDRLRKAAEAANVSTSVGEEEIGEISASYFRALERLLGDTLAFCTWAMVADHVRQDNPYLYVENDSVLALTTATLGPLLAAGGDIPDDKFGIERWTLQPLMRGFDSLSRVLRRLEDETPEHIRPASSTPDFAGQTELQRFPFRHTVPFLDLTKNSKERICFTLTETTRLLVGSGAAEIRNGLLHYRRSNIDLARLVDSLAAVEGVVRTLEAQGFVRIVFRSLRIESDRWGRSLHTLVDGQGAERVVGRPSTYAWVNLPALHRPQYLMTVAQFEQMGEYLRFRPGSDSEFRRLWSGVPQRRLASVVGSRDEGTATTLGGSVTS